MLAEAGCLEYGPMIDAARAFPARSRSAPNTVTVVEKWQSPAALAAHLATPHMQKFFADTESMRVGRSWRPAAGVRRCFEILPLSLWERGRG